MGEQIVGYVPGAVTEREIARLERAPVAAEADLLRLTAEELTIARLVHHGETLNHLIDPVKLFGSAEDSLRSAGHVVDHPKSVLRRRSAQAVLGTRR